MRQLFSVFLFILVSSQVFGQQFQWAQAFQNTKSDKVTCVRVSDSGFVFAAGYFGNNIKLGTNLLTLTYTGSAQSKEAFIAKFDSLGFCLWARSAGNGLDDRVLGLTVDKNGNSIITGTFWSSGFKVNPSITINGQGGGDQGFLVKYDPNGNAIWGNYVTSTGGDDQGLDVSSDDVGNIYVVGFMTGSNLKVGGNVVTVTNANGNAFNKHSYWIAKFNPSGIPQWAHCFGNLPFDTTYGKYIEREIAVCTDKQGGVYVTGGFDHTWPFGTGTLTSTGGYDVFVMKYDSSGSFKWATRGGSRKDDWANGICADNQGHIYVVGEHRDSLFYDTVIIKNFDGRDVFVMKMDASNGRPIWGKRAGTNNGSERGNDVKADSLCNVYICGDVWSGAEFGDNITTPPTNKLQSFVAKISPDGKWKWVSTGGGADSNDRCSSLDITKSGQIYTGGFYRTAPTFGSINLTYLGSSDAWLAKIQDSTFGKGGTLALNRPIDSVKCFGDTIQYFVPLPNQYTTFDYNPKGGNVSFNVATGAFVFSAIGTTTYTLNILGTDLCAEPDSVIFTIKGDTLAEANFSLAPENVPNYNPIFTVINLSVNATNHIWYVDDSLWNSDPSLILTLPKVGSHCFKLIAFNSEGCSDTIVKCGKVIVDERVIVPNSFTPNGDLLNVSIIPKFFNIDNTTISDYRFEVIDRMGTVVFKSTKVGEGWDGSYKSTIEKCEVGTYFYFIKYNSPDKKGQLEKGDILLMR
jgi:gliding motility-associated-like protein